MAQELDETIRLTGVHEPRFRGDHRVGLFVGSIWCAGLGLFGVFVGTMAGQLNWIPLVWTACLWAYAVFLLYRWKMLGDGVTVLLTQTGYVQFPKNVEPPSVRPWGDGLEINFTRSGGVWHLAIMKGIRRDLGTILQNCSDEEIASLAGKVRGWQRNPVFVETIS